METRVMTSARTQALVAALAVALWSWPVSGADGDGGEAVEEGCDPAVYEALAESARMGVEQDLVVIRHPEQGIVNPQSIFDFSCLEDMFDYQRFNIFFDPQRGVTELLGLVQKQVCAVARDAYWRYVGRAMDSDVYTAEWPRLPGLVVTRERGKLLRDDGGRFRRLMGVSQ